MNEQNRIPNGEKYLPLVTHSGIGAEYLAVDSLLAIGGKWHPRHERIIFPIHMLAQVVGLNVARDANNWIIAGDYRGNPLVRERAASFFANIRFVAASLYYDASAAQFYSLAGYLSCKIVRCLVRAAKRGNAVEAWIPDARPAPTKKKTEVAPPSPFEFSKKKAKVITPALLVKIGGIQEGERVFFKAAQLVRIYGLRVTREGNEVREIRRSGKPIDLEEGLLLVERISNQERLFYWDQSERRFAGSDVEIATLIVPRIVQTVVSVRTNLLNATVAALASSVRENHNDPDTAP